MDSLIRPNATLTNILHKARRQNVVDFRLVYVPTQITILTVTLMYASLEVGEDVDWSMNPDWETETLRLEYPNEFAVSSTDIQPTALTSAVKVATIPTIVARLNGIMDDVYTLMFYDLDAPTATSATCRSYLHWLRVNIRGRDGLGGEDLISYEAPTPAHSTGTHRYVFELYRQNTVFLGTPSPTARCGFAHVTWAEKNHLQPKPVALATFTINVPRPM